MCKCNKADNWAVIDSEAREEITKKILFETEQSLKTFTGNKQGKKIK